MAGEGAGRCRAARGRGVLLAASGITVLLLILFSVMPAVTVFLRTSGEARGATSAPFVSRLRPIPAALIGPLREATDAVHADTLTIPEKHTRDEALRNIVRALANTGREQEAIDLARANRDWESPALASIAERLLSRGRIDEARRIVDTIQSEYGKVRLRLKIADAYRLAKRPEFAQALLVEIPASREFWRSYDLVSSQALVYARLGDKDTARALFNRALAMRAEGPLEDSYRLMMMGVIEERQALGGLLDDAIAACGGQHLAHIRLAEGLLAAGDVDGSLRLAPHCGGWLRLDILTKVAPVLAERGRRAEAIGVLRQAAELVQTFKESDRGTGRAKVVVAMARVGDLAATQPLLRYLEDPERGPLVADALADCAEALREKAPEVSRRLLRQAEQQAALITGAYSHAYALHNIALVRYRLGDVDLARRDMAEAMDICRKDLQASPKSGCDFVLKCIGISQGKHGENEAAVAALEEVFGRYAGNRDRVKELIANIRDAGLHDLAAQMAAKAGLPPPRPPAFDRFATSQPATSDGHQALAWVLRLPSPAERASALAQLTEALIQGPASPK
jgi:tetratricopeptide (TPR) repeat protein